MMNRTTRTFAALAGTLAMLSGCKEDEGEPSGGVGATESIQWEVYHQFEGNEHVRNFTVSDDAKWLFYAEGRTVIRIDKATGTRKELFYDRYAEGNTYVHFIDGKLYLIYGRNNRSYFAVSRDLGETLTEYHVGTSTNVAAGQFEGAFIRLFVNRLFVLPSGDLVLPYVFSNPNSYLYVSDGQLLAISRDGGATWNRKSTEHSYIMAQQGNRLFAVTGSWKGDFGIGGGSGLLYSDDIGTTWHNADLRYAPQAVDRRNNLVAGARNEIQRLKGNTWTIYTWDERSQPLVTVTPLANAQTGTNLTRSMADMAFDNADNVYIMGLDNKLCKARLH